jgi:uncharacterized iron-regulated membrane protein
MPLLNLLHRWTGAIVGLLLAVIGLSGTILLWEDVWVSVPGAEAPFRPDADPAAAVAAAADEGPLSYITFASEDFGLHQAIYADDSGAYLDQDGQVVAQWTSQRGRPELWLFDLHHHLLAGDTGEIVTGVLGLLLVFFSISGAVLWWRTRKTFQLRLLPPRMTRPAIVRHHRDIGIVSVPVLLLVAVTGTLMVFKPLSQLVLAPLGDTSARPQAPVVAAAPSAVPDWPAVIAAAHQAFPGAVLRRVQLSSEPGKAATVRFRQSFEWTPNGRSYAYVDLSNATVVERVDPATGNAAQGVQEKFYPLHAGKVGGLAWKLALTAAGLALVMLGTFASWSFWFRRPKLKAHQVPAGAEPEVWPAE